MLWVLLGACVGGAALIWMLWVLPVASSVADAAPVPLGEISVVDAAAGESVGVWASGPAALLGLAECTGTDAAGHDVPLFAGATPDWDDVLWWMTPRDGFRQVLRAVPAAPGEVEIVCVSAMDAYEGQFLLAGDSFGAGSVGLGRGGNVDYPVGTLLALGAVTLPLFSVLLLVVLIVQTLVSRGRRIRTRGRA